MRRISAVLLVVVALLVVGCMSAKEFATEITPDVQAVTADYVRMIDTYEPGVDEPGKRWAATRKGRAEQLRKVVVLGAGGEE